MKFSRIWQPDNPQFWILLILNGVSSLISFVLRTYELPLGLTWLLAGFAIANVLMGLGIAWRLMQPAPDKPAAASG